MNAQRPLRLVICVNERLGAGQRSCAGSGSRLLLTELKQRLADAAIDVPIVERECLGRCAEGPAMRIAPGGDFFTQVNDSTLETIVDLLRQQLTTQSD